MIALQLQQESSTDGAALLPDRPTPQLTDDERAEYAAVAAAVGFAPAALIADRLVAQLAVRGLYVYDYDRVVQYLNGLFGEVDEERSWSQTWSWCPLRPVDLDRLRRDRSHISHNGTFYWQRTYHEAIPLPVLHLVKALSDEIPELRFAVSSRVSAADRTGDPFLIAVLPNDERVVIAKWDESSFKG